MLNSVIAGIIAAMSVTFSIFDWEPQEVRISCYCPTGNKTYTGAVPFEGGCACNKEHLGQVAMLFDADMRFICFLDCNDIGGNHLLREGKAVDVFRDNLDRAYQFIAENGDHGYVVWLDAEG